MLTMWIGSSSVEMEFGTCNGGVVERQINGGKIIISVKSPHEN